MALTGLALGLNLLGGASGLLSQVRTSAERRDRRIASGGSDPVLRRLRSELGRQSADQMARAQRTAAQYATGRTPAERARNAQMGMRHAQAGIAQAHGDQLNRVSSYGFDSAMQSRNANRRDARNRLTTLLGGFAQGLNTMGVASQLMRSRETGSSLNSPNPANVQQALDQQSAADAAGKRPGVFPNGGRGEANLQAEIIKRRLEAQRLERPAGLDAPQPGMMPPVAAPQSAPPPAAMPTAPAGQMPMQGAQAPTMVPGLGVQPRPSDQMMLRQNAAAGMYAPPPQERMLPSPVQPASEPAAALPEQDPRQAMMQALIQQGWDPNEAFAEAYVRAAMQNGGL